MFFSVVGDMLLLVNRGCLNEEKKEIDGFILDDCVTTYYNNHVHAVACPEDCTDEQAKMIQTIEIKNGEILMKTEAAQKLL